MDEDSLQKQCDMAYESAQEAVQIIKSKLDANKQSAPKFGIICGSGLSHIADVFERCISIPYSEIPGLPSSDVVGHLHYIKIGDVNGKKSICFQGRFHYYEGNPMWKVTLPIRIMRLLGVKVVFITNVCGGANPSYLPGDIMVIKDHINVTNCNPLIGKNDDRWGTRFPDLENAYDRNLRHMCSEAFKKYGLQDCHREGVYFMLTGPSYETKAETKMIHIVGGDAVGMSTIPEVIVARHCGMKVCAMSLITTTVDFNKYEQEQSGFDHEIIVAAATKGGQNIALIIQEIIANLKL